MIVYHSSAVQIGRRSQLDKVVLSIESATYIVDGIVSNISLDVAIQHSLVVCLFLAALSSLVFFFECFLAKRLSKCGWSVKNVGMRSIGKSPHCSWCFRVVVEGQSMVLFFALPL